LIFAINLPWFESYAVWMKASSVENGSLYPMISPCEKYTQSDTDAQLSDEILTALWTLLKKRVHILDFHAHEKPPRTREINRFSGSAGRPMLQSRD
jgi:hypothetical protein